MRCVRGEDQTVVKAELHLAFVDWWREQGYVSYPPALTVFARLLRRVRPELTTGRQGAYGPRYYRGIGLRP